MTDEQNDNSREHAEPAADEPDVESTAEEPDVDEPDVESAADVSGPEDTDEQQEESSGGLDRRDFLKASAVVGTAGAAAAGCPGLFEDDEEVHPDLEEVRHQVRPGELDEYYAFISGGQAGDVRVYGLPSGRQIMRIPVFNYEPARGWGFDDESREMLEIDGGGFTWGDTHHPRLSQTDNDYDGRWAFINDKANGRMARIDLKYFVTDAILDIPNHQGTHGACAVMPDTRYVVGVGELEVPIPNDGRHLDEPENYQTTLTAIDPETMMIEWEVLLNVNLDNMDSGKQGEWFFASSYNTENGVDEAGMTRADQDYTIAFNIPAIEAAVDAGEYDEINGIPVVDGTEDSPLNEGDDPVTRYVPTPKNPHGVAVTPDGRYAIVSGKLDPSTTVIDIEALNEVDDPADAIAAQPRLGMGPLHTAYDGRGHAYTTLFVDSQVVKWDIERAVEAHPEDGEDESPAVIEKIDVHYNPGHIIASESYTADPAGDWLLSLNKLSKDRFMNVGPVFPDNDQLIYIGDDEAGMQLVRDIPAYPEPHDASICHRDKLDPQQVYEPDDLQLEHTAADESTIERVDDDRVEVKMYSIRNHYGFSDITVQQGDTVEIQVTNVETTTDILHGLGIPEFDVHLKIAPQETVKATFTADEPGVYWMYCTYFCSALHLEMRSRLLVEPAEPPPVAEDTIATVGERHFSGAQQAIDAAEPGETIVLEGRFDERLVIDTDELTVRAGGGGAVVDAGGEGRVVTIDAGDVTVDGLWIRGSGHDLGDEHAGVFVHEEAHGAALTDLYLDDIAFGMWVDGADGVTVADCTIRGRDDVLPVVNRGNGIQLWDADDAVIEDNHITGVRDGIYFSWSEGVVATANVLAGNRYGVHYMYSSHNRLESNTAVDNDVGYALMVSNHLEIVDNTALSNAGASGHGILVKDIDDTVIRANTVVDNANGLFVYHSHNNRIESNLVLQNDVGLHHTAGSESQQVSANSFIANDQTVITTGHDQRAWNGNYWSDARTVDLNHDGTSQIRYRPSGLVEHLVDRLPVAAAFTHSPAFDAIRLAENSFPVIDAPGVIDEKPLADAPHPHWRDHAIDR